MKEFTNILYPVSLTNVSPNVSPYVVAMAKKLGAQVHLIHVLRRFDLFAETYVSDYPVPDFKRIASDFENQLLKQAQKKLEAFKQRYLEGLHVANAVVITGTHYKEILDYVKEKGIDFIIMGAGTPMQKVLFGSVTEKVSRLATVPVMLINSSS